MKILNYSYRKVTCCKTNSWKSGGRHSRVFQVFPDISISLTHKQTNTTQANLLDTNTDDASKILDVISWLAITFTRKWGGPSFSGSIQAAMFPRLSRCCWHGRWRWGCIDKKDYNKSQEFTSRLFFSCSHEELFSCIISILTSILMDCILCAWSCAKFKG